MDAAGGKLQLDASLRPRCAPLGSPKFGLGREDDRDPGGHACVEKTSLPACGDCEGASGCESSDEVLTGMEHDLVVAQARLSVGHFA